MRDFVFITTSEEKVREASEILGLAIEQVCLDLPEIQAATAAPIALQKAREGYARVGRPCVAEDSALEFAAWNGLPGPFIKWFEKRQGLELLCRALDAFEDRRATAVCALAVKSPQVEFVVEGRCEGRIALRPAGAGGFGWDTIFLPEGQPGTFAEMSSSEKNALSHRRKAWGELRRRLSGGPDPGGGL